MLIAAVVVALAAALAGMAGGGDVIAELLRYWRRALRREVDDPDRRAAGEATLEEFEREAAELATSLHDWMLAFGRVHRRYESTEGDYDRLTESLVEDFYRAQLQLLDVADQMRLAIGEAAFVAITDDVEAQLRKLRAKQERRAAKQRSQEQTPPR